MYIMKTRDRNTRRAFKKLSAGFEYELLLLLPGFYFVVLYIIIIIIFRMTGPGV